MTMKDNQFQLMLYKYRIRIHHEFVGMINNPVSTVTIWHQEALSSDAKQCVTIWHQEALPSDAKQ